MIEEEEDELGRLFSPPLREAARLTPLPRGGSESFELSRSLESGERANPESRPEGLFDRFKLILEEVSESVSSPPPHQMFFISKMIYSIDITRLNDLLNLVKYRSISILLFSFTDVLSLSPSDGPIFETNMKRYLHTDSSSDGIGGGSNSKSS